MNVGTRTRALACGLAAAAAALTACYDPGFEPCTIECALDGDACPGGMECGTDGLCVDPGGACVDTSGPVRRTVAAGAEHVCAIATDKLWCWGDNRRGQLALAPTTTDSAIPVEITPSGLTGGTWIDLAAGAYHTCALYHFMDNTTLDEIVCWGDNTSLQLGTSAGDPIFFRPTRPPSTRWLGIGAGDHHSCAIGTDDATTQVYCWGGNDGGQLAGAVGTATATPTRVQSPDVTGTWRMVDGGARHTCAATTEAELVCWGDNASRQLSGSTDATTPRAVEPPGAYAIVAAGDNHTCAITRQGMVQCWGDNAGGRLGIASTNLMIDTPAPVLADGSTARWDRLDTSASVTCGIKGDSTYCWGPGAPQAGLGTLGTGQPAPAAPVHELGAMTDIAASPMTSCAGTRDSVACWGDSLHGELGDGTYTIAWAPEDIAVPPLSAWESVVAGATHTCAIARNTTNNELTTYCWGLGDRGQVGGVTPGLDDAAASPVARDTASASARSVAVGSRHTCVVNDVVATTTSELRCWGDDSQEQNPAASEGAVFSLMQSDNPAITADGAFTCVTGSNTHIPLCWGTPDTNPGHVLGTPSPVSANTQLLEDSVEWGFESGCGLHNGTNLVWCFGTEHVGELGNGALGDPPWPMSGAATLVSPMDVMAHGGGQTRCAGRSASGIVCWGDNTHGQVKPTMPGGSVDTPTVTILAGQSAGLVAIAVGPGHGCAIVSSGNTVTCWGAYEVGQRTSLPASTDTSLITNPSPGVTTWLSISAGAEHTCAIADAGRLLCWGRDTYGQLGNGKSARPAAGPVTLP